MVDGNHFEEPGASVREAIRRAERPPVPFDALLEASGGHIYGVAAPRPASRDLTTGPGWSQPSEEDTDVIALELFYLVGKNREKVSVETSWWTPILVTSQVRSVKAFRTLTLPVDGVPKTFRVHDFDLPDFAASLIASAKIARLRVTVAGPRELVPALELASVPPRKLERWLDPGERRRDRRGRRPSRPSF